MTNKYPIDLYTDSGFWEPDEDVIDQNEKVVKCRKQHNCVGGMRTCQGQIQKGEHAVRCEAIIRGEGRKSCYVCFPCIEWWLEESGQVIKENEE